MNSRPLVSIMIPTYNQASVISKAIDSALNQDYENIEILVSDDNSTDNTKLILKKYESNDRVRINFNISNLGRVANYRHLVNNIAKGEWAVNLDGDDYFTNNHFISTAIKYILSSEEPVAFVQGGHTVRMPSGEIILESLPKISSPAEVISGNDYFINFNHFSHLATVYNRTIASTMDFYRYDILSSDIESILRLALHGKVILLKESVGVWVHHDTNESKNLNIDVVEKNMLRFKAPYLYAVEKGIIPKSILKNWLNKKKNSYIFYYLVQYFKNPMRLKGYLLHVIKKYPARAIAILPLAMLKSLKANK